MHDLKNTYQVGRTPNTTCDQCSKSFYKSPKYKEEDKHNYCSWNCSSKARIKLVKCKMCPNTFNAGLNKATCSKDCAIKYRNSSERKHCTGRKKKPKYFSHGTRSLKKQLLSERGKKCELCPYDKWQVLNIHHIIEKAKDGSDKKENLLLICPNCHAEIHKGLRKVNQAGPESPC